jgi:tetratricopeptide (TPR) repeat protein
MPETVESLVATRIDKLAPGDRALLRWASVLGVSFSGSLITAVLEDDPTSASDSEAWDRLAEFVERDPDVAGAFRFRHALIRDGAYEGLSFKRRRELHARVAEVLEERDPEGVELLSLHSYRGEQWPETWRHSVAAGRRAQAKWANLEAAEFYQRSLEAVKRVPDISPGEVAQVWESLGDCLQLAGRFEAAAEAYDGARRLLPKDSIEVIELIEKEGALQEGMGNYDEAIRRYNRGLKTTDRVADERVRTSLRAKLNFGLAEARFRQGHLDESIKGFNTVVQQALEIDDTEQLGWAYMFLHMVHMFRGSDERAAFRGLALPLFEEIGHLKGQATALNNLGIEAYYEGDWEKALDVYKRGRRLFERIGDVTNVAMTTSNIGEILSDQGRFDEAGELFEEARRAVDAAGHRALSLMARMNLGRLAARQGRFDEAETWLDEAVKGFHEIEASSLEEEARTRIAEAAVLAGDHERATREADLAELTGEANPPPPLQAVLHRVRGYALLQQSHEADAIQEFRRGLLAARSGDALYEIALTLHALGRAGDEAAAAEAKALLERLDVAQVAEVPF